MKRREFLRTSLAATIPFSLIATSKLAHAQVEALVIAEAGTAPYWLATIEAALPYIQTFAGLYSVLSSFGPDSQDVRLKRIEDELRSLTARVAQLEDVIKNLILDDVAKQLSAEVLAYKDSLDSYVTLKQQGILDNVLTQSAVTKNRLLQYIDDNTLPHSYRYYFGALLNACTSLRLSCIGLYSALQASRDKLLAPEAKAMLSRVPRVMQSAQAISEKRVATTSQVVLIDELGPIYGTTMSVTLDGKHVWGEFWGPSKGGERLSAMRQRATDTHRQYVSQANAQATGVLLQNVTAVQKMLSDIAVRNPSLAPKVPAQLKSER